MSDHNKDFFHVPLMFRDGGDDYLATMGIHGIDASWEDCEAFRQCVMQNPVVVQLLINPEDGRIIEANQAALDFYGYTKSQLLGLRIFDLNTLPPKDVSGLMGLVKQTGVQKFTFNHRVANGSDRRVEVHSMPVTLDGVTCLFSTILDITEREITLRSLRESEEKYRFIFENEHDAIILFDLDTNHIFDANTTATQMYGYTYPELTSLNTVQLTWDEDAAVENLRNLRESGTLQLERHYHRRSSGEALPVEIEASTFPYQGRAVGCAIIRDISSRIEYENALAEAAKQAREASQAKSSFLTNMSHEIRTPLNGLLGVLQLLRVSCEKQENRELVEMALGSGGKLLTLLTDMLDLARIESGKLELTQAPFNPRDLIDSVVQMNRLGALGNKTHISAEYADNLPTTLDGPEQQIMQVVSNLVSNAVKFTAGGTITVRILPVLHEDDKAMFTVQVEDTGIGIPEEKQASIFEPFMRVKGEFGKEYDGAGLGLRIAQTLVEQMGGTITLRSQLGHGTTIIMSVPVDASNECASAIERVCVTSASVVASVLLVEDDKVARLATQRLLERSGVLVSSAENAEQCFELLRRDSFDVVLMDIQMPDMSGLEATQIIRSDMDGLPSDIPIVALTAHAFTDDKIRCLEAGMNGYLTKPVEMDILLKEIQRVLDPSIDPNC